MTMLSPSLACDLSIGSSRLSGFLPASVINVALAFSFFATVQPAWNNYFPNGRINPVTFAMNAIGDVFSSTKPKEILAHISPTPTIKGPPTPTLPYQPESTPSIFYVVTLCAVLVLVGAVFTVLRNLSSSSSSACNNGSSLIDDDIPEHFGASSNETPAAPNDDPFDPSSSNNSAESESKFLGINSSEFIGDIGGSPPPPPPPSFTTSGMDDDSNKKVTRFFEKFKMFLILFFILTTLTHGGRITQKMRSLAIPDLVIFSANNASAKPFFRQALELVTTKVSSFDGTNGTPATFTIVNTLVPEIVETLTLDIPSSSTPSAMSQVKYNEIPSSGFSAIFSSSIFSSYFSSVSNQEYDPASFPLPTKDAMSYIPMSAYPLGLSPVTGTPTSPSPSMVALAVEYIKMFTLFFVFCILIPILSFVITTLPTIIQFVQLWKSRPADQQETFTHADNAMKSEVDVNEVVLATEVVENDKVDINLIHDKVVPGSMFIDKGSGRALEAIEEKDEDETASCSFVSKESLERTAPTLSSDNLADRPRRPHTRHVRTQNKRRRKAEQAAIEAALNAPFI